MCTPFGLQFLITNKYRINGNSPAKGSIISTLVSEKNYWNICAFDKI